MPHSDSGRLPKGVRPKSYKIHLTIEPEARRFFGTVSIDVTIDHVADSIQLHALQLEIGAVSIGSIACDVMIDPSSEAIRISPPTTIPASDIVLKLAFAGTFNQQMRGLYETRASGETFAFTQFEATDARRMFPCFDEPALKARFSLTVTVPAHLVALSNMPVVEETVEGKKKHVQFDQTPLMSTYLLALAVARLEKQATEIAGIPVAVWALPGQLALTAFALKVSTDTSWRSNSIRIEPEPDTSASKTPITLRRSTATLRAARA